MDYEDIPIAAGIKPMLTIGEVSRLLHVHNNTLRRWSDNGIIKAYRIGTCGHRRFRQDDIVLFLTRLNVYNGDSRKV